MPSLLIGQSGGPTSVINATVKGAFLEGLKSSEINHLYGALHGLGGILSEDFIEIKKEDDLLNWETTPGAILGSIRFKISYYPEDKPIYEKILNVFKKYDIRYFFYTGGNDSMDTCNKIDLFFKEVGYKCSVIGLPKTVDNDLVNIDHCPGYGSACKMVATTISEIYHDTACYEAGRVTIIEVMGRDAGWLTASTHLANLGSNGPDLVYLPEAPFDMNEFLESTKKVYEKRKKVLVCVSEGIRDKNNRYVLRYRDFNNNDAFGHLQLGGVALVLAEEVNLKLNLPVRAIELNLPQRCASHIASKTDVKEALKCGKFGVKMALKNKTGYMVSMERLDSLDYKIKYKLVKLDSVATKVKRFPKEWIINNHSISDEYVKYALPLIKGESYPKYQNGLPIYAKIKK